MNANLKISQAALLDRAQDADSTNNTEDAMHWYQRAADLTACGEVAGPTPEITRMFDQALELEATGGLAAADPTYRAVAHVGESEVRMQAHAVIAMIVALTMLGLFGVAALIVAAREAMLR